MSVLGYAVLGYTVLGQPEATGGGGTTDGAAVNAYAVAVRADVADTYLVGAVVPLAFTVEDADGYPLDPASVTLTITRDGATAATFTPTHTAGTGLYTLNYATATAGHYTARFTSTSPTTAVEDVFEVTAVSASALTVATLRTYLGDVSWSDSEIGNALNAERYAQAARCRIDPYTPDLLEALKRRVARNLAARSVPVATFTSFEGGATTQRVPAIDAEVKRLEAPYRRRVVA